MDYKEIYASLKRLLKAGAKSKRLLQVTANIRRMDIEKELFNRFNGVIQDGFFKEVKLPPTPHDSVLTPKLLGTYEIEIAKDIKFLAERSRVFIDIGCAEGYYTTGIAAKTSVEKVVGVDVSSEALELAIGSAKRNKVENKCIFENKLSNALAHIESGCFVMSDVDGSERKVLNELGSHINANGYQKINILIETDFDRHGRSNKQEIAEQIDELGFDIIKIIDCNPLCTSRFSPLARKIYSSYLDHMICALERANSNQSWIIAATR